MATTNKRATAFQQPETGWAIARRLRKNPVRTTMPARNDCSENERRGGDSNIVLSEN